VIKSYPAHPQVLQRDAGSEAMLMWPRNAEIDLAHVTGAYPVPYVPPMVDPVSNVVAVQHGGQTTVIHADFDQFQRDWEASRR
jgi:hypothetical protein